MVRQLVASLAIAVGAMAAPDAAAEIVEVSYVGTVRAVGGVADSLGRAGHPVRVSYVVDTAVADPYPDANFARYAGALRELRVTFPQSGIQMQARAGAVQVQVAARYGDQVSNQVHFSSAGPLSASAPMGMHEATQMTLAFGVFNGQPGVAPTVLTTDALPTVHLSALTDYLSFETTGGYTYMWLDLAPAPTTFELVADARERVQELVATRQMLSSIAAVLTRHLTAVESNVRAGDKNEACRVLARFLSDVELFARVRMMSASAATEMRAYHAELVGSLGGC